MSGSTKQNSLIIKESSPTDNTQNLNPNPLTNKNNNLNGVDFPIMGIGLEKLDEKDFYCKDW